MDNSHPAPKAPLGYGRISATQSNKNTISTSLLTWENDRHLATLSLVPHHLRNERRNSILMTRHYPDLGSSSDWLNQISHEARPIRSTTQIWVVTCRHYGISALVSQTSLGGETSGSVAKYRLFSQATSL